MAVVGGVTTLMKRGWLRELPALAQHASPGEEAGLLDVVGLTEFPDAELRPLPVLDEIKPAGLFAGIETLGHKAPPLVPMLSSPGKVFSPV